MQTTQEDNKNSEKRHLLDANTRIFHVKIANIQGMDRGLLKRTSSIEQKGLYTMQGS